MLAKVFSAAIFGIDAYKVEIEVNATGYGQELSVNTVGLPDNAVRESRDRVHSAIESCGFRYPYGKTIINLAPADVKKEGAGFDLPIAIGMLSANGELKNDKLGHALIIGELALNGTVRPVKGVLPMAVLASRDDSITMLLVPTENAAEASIAAGNALVYPVATLKQAADFLNGDIEIEPARETLESVTSRYEIGRIVEDFADIKGQSYAKRALQIAAAGGHNLLMIGPPGAGKSMLAKRMPGILPPLHVHEALEVTKIHSILGMLKSGQPILTHRPFRSPHHTISDAGLLGGQSVPTPGEVSLAHNGVLFLDELPEFKRNVLEVLRQPLENGSVTISRAAGSLTFPASFMLIAAMNPCPCGHYGSMQRECRCPSPSIQRYRGRISGPLLDRIDIHIEVTPLSEDELVSAPSTESSAQMGERVRVARSRQLVRFEGEGIFANAQMGSAHLQKFCPLDAECVSLLRQSIREFQLSARAYDRIIRVARTIADLEGSENIGTEHLHEAVQYRTLDRRLW